MQHSIHRSFVLSACASVFLGSSIAQTSVFIGSSVLGSSDPWYLVNVDTSLLIDQGNSTSTDNASGAFFHPDSADLVVTSALGQEVTSAPVIGLSPNFQTPVFQTSVSGGNLHGCLYDPRFKRIFSVTRNGLVGSAHILDGDTFSPTYGALLHTIQLPIGAERFGLSEDSTLLATPGAVFDGSLSIIDVDPASAGFLSVTQTVATTLPGTSFALGATFSPDNRFASVVLFGFGSGTSVAKYDRQTQTWIDAIAALPGTQHFPIPVSTPQAILPIRGTESALVAAPNGSLNLLEMPGVDPANWSFSTLQDYVGSLQGIALSPDRTRLAITLSNPPRLVIANATDGAILTEASLPLDATNLYTVAWSDEGLNPMSYCNPAAVNSTGASGDLTGSGSALVVDNDVTLMARDLPPLSFGFLITSRTQGFVSNPAGSQGNLCLSGPIGRYVGPGQIRQASVTGEWALSIDLTQQPQPTGPVSVVIGDSWNYQAWYRDSVGGQAVSNFTNGLALNFR